jgi:hypothetical protein
MSVRLYIRTKLLGSYWKGFHKTWYFIILRKSVEKIQVSLKSDNKNGNFT